MSQSESPFPRLALAGWQPTRATVRIYARLLAKIRWALTPRQKHWQHTSLRVVPDGLTTTPLAIPGTRDQAFEMILGLGPAQGGHRLSIRSTRGESWELELRGQSARHFSDTVLAFLASMGVHPAVDTTLFADTAPGAYDFEAVERFAVALNRIDGVLKRFKTELPGESSPVQFWSHNFDLALTWLSGRRVPGSDPADEERADEQVTFGFSTGDEATPDPYFYTIANPWPHDLHIDADPPPGARWHTAPWRGAELLYESLVGIDGPEAYLLEFLRSAYRIIAGRQQAASPQPAEHKAESV